MKTGCPFTPEELSEMRGALSVLVAVTMRHSRALIGRAWEVKSLLQFFMKARGLHPENSTLQCLFDQQQAVGMEAGLPDPFAHGEKNDAEVKQCFIRMAQVRDLLDERLSFEEAAELKSVFYQAAFELASASGDGILGTGQRVNADEADFLRCLKEILIDQDQS